MLDGSDRPVKRQSISQYCGPGYTPLIYRKVIKICLTEHDVSFANFATLNYSKTDSTVFLSFDIKIEDPELDPDSVVVDPH
jgi:hypothetical protein